jgi:hypothetical protein
MKQLCFVSAALLAVSSSIMADSVTSATGNFAQFPTGFGSSTQAWVNFDTPPAPANTPFWNNPSQDTGVGGSHMMNVGNLLTDSGGFAGTPAALGSDTVTGELTAAGGADPTAFNFVSTATLYNLTLLYANSSLDTGNARQGTVFGYYIGTTFTPLFAPSNTNSPMGKLPFDPTTAGTSYGFYATVNYGNGLWETYTTGAGNFGNDGGSAGWNHFALFQLASGGYAMGFEDGLTDGGEGLGDYNDVVVEISQVPEPDTIALLGIGLALLCLGRHRRLLRNGEKERGSFAGF